MKFIYLLYLPSGKLRSYKKFWTRGDVIAYPFIIHENVIRENACCRIIFSCFNLKQLYTKKIFEKFRTNRELLRQIDPLFENYCRNFISRNQIKYLTIHTFSELQKKGVNSEVNEDMLRHRGTVAILLYLSFAANDEEYAWHLYLNLPSCFFLRGSWNSSYLTPTA